MHLTKTTFFSLFISLVMLQARAENLEVPEQEIEYVTVAILAKDKAHTLPLYLSCIENQTWPASKTYLYIRTNNNNDETAAMLREWVAKVGDRYAVVHFDDSDVQEQVQRFGQHEWNYERFVVLGKIRQDSVDWAREHKSHYFVADCDNFIKPHTIQALVEANLPIVAPLMRTWDICYANFHAAVDKNGYYEHDPIYYSLFYRDIVGLTPVPVVHCTYLIRYEVLDTVVYNDGSGRYEYVIFSDTARKCGIPQYLDTRDFYGYITFAENAEHMASQPWLDEYAKTT